jgi:hypothetical protein
MIATTNRAKFRPMDWHGEFEQKELPLFRLGLWAGRLMALFSINY